jgi:PrtD family type I secretion system ABC transporter
MARTANPLSTRKSALERAYGAARRLFGVVGVFSLFINLMMLATPLYMLQVYDRVLTSRSVDTLIALSVLVIGLLGVSALLEVLRGRLLVRIGTRFDAEITEALFAAPIDRRLRKGDGSSSQPFHDLETLRGFIGGAGLVALFDMPWMPLYIALIFLFHPLLGVIALGGAVVLFVLALVSELSTRKPMQAAATRTQQARDLAEASVRNAEVVRAMGMFDGLRARWLDVHREALGLNVQAQDVGGVISTFAKFIRFILQVAVLGVGAWLVILEQITPGVMIAASIILGRGLAPVEAAIAHWRSMISARGASRRIRSLIEAHGVEREGMPLPAPAGKLVVDAVTARPPGVSKPALYSVSFALAPGEALGLIGPSAAGKSTLARILVGVWQPTVGHVRLDAADIADWDPRQLGPHIGYLPQDVELFSGTVAENIARFGAPDPERVVKAARCAGSHELILHLPEGYDTQIGESGSAVSAGQRQRIALARALYGDPALVVLDEPNANLDAEGEEALRGALTRLHDNKQTVIVISHRPSVLAVVDQVMVLRNGRVETIGTREEVLPKMVRTVRDDSAPGAPGQEAGNVIVTRMSDVQN